MASSNRITACALIRANDVTRYFSKREVLRIAGSSQSASRVGFGPVGAAVYFHGQAAAEIDRLSAALSRAEQELAASASAGFLDAGHRVRLESVILQQESEMAQLNAALDRVRALRDLTQWAVGTGTGDETGGTIRITDLSRALNTSGSTEASA